MAATNVLLTALQNANLYAHPVAEFQLIETHISWVLLTGHYAYKIKKPVNLGFLDFSNVEKRRYYCEEELRLNRRLAPTLYMDVVAITGTGEQPILNGTGPVVEYAVKMRQFPTTSQFDALLSRGELTAQHVELLADAIAAFHRTAPRADESSNFGAPAVVTAPMTENFRQIRSLLDDSEDLALLETVRNWTEQAATALRSTLSARRDHGFTRECHGDLHLGNVAWLDEKPLIFDCIEFNPALRWIDTMSEVAFTMMDLTSRHRSDLAFRFLNRNLEQSGDYAGVTLLPFFAVYRALVRSKVESIRASQSSEPHHAHSVPAHRAYLQLAARLIAPRPTPLIITHGLSGSGKTTVSTALCERLGAIRIRSDVERKRLFSGYALDRHTNKPDRGIYGTEASAQTYAHLERLADSVLAAGFPVIIDAAFLKRYQRECFAALAAKRQIPFLIVDCQSPPHVLESRLLTRLKAATDASDAGLEVLAHQRATAEALAPDERSHTLTVDTSLGAPAFDEFLQRLVYGVLGASAMP